MPRESRIDLTNSQVVSDDPSRKASMVFTIDEKDLYGQWNHEPPLSCAKEPDLASTDEKPQEWKPGYLLKLFYFIGAAGAAVTTYLLYRACLYPPPAVDFED